MPAPMQLGSVLGGRYKVVSDVLATAEGDHVLEGQDQVLGRRVSILLPADQHASLLVENARSLASGRLGAPFQILDLGQADEHTYLVTSHTRAADMLDSLLVAPEEIEDESLSDDIFGTPRGDDSGTYGYDEPEPTRAQPVVATEPSDDLGGAAPEAKVTRWTEDDSYDDAAPAPSVRTRLGRPVRVSASSTRSTLFDRAAASGTAAAAGRTGPAPEIDPGYDGDNRYDSYDKGQDVPRPEPDAASSAASPGDPGGGSSTHQKGGKGLLVLLLVLLALLVGGVAVSFDRLGELFGGMDDRTLADATAPDPEPTTEPTPEPTPEPSPEPTSQSPAVDPEAVAVNRLVPGRPNFMADQDARLGQTIDGNPATYWISYGFSDQNFGNQAPSVGLAVQLEEPAPVETLRLTQAAGSGGLFDVYVNDSPTLNGAQQVGSGSFTGPEITVPLAAAAQDGEHEYVIVNWTQLPRLTQPIAGFNHGLRIGEIQLD